MKFDCAKAIASCWFLFLSLLFPHVGSATEDAGGIGFASYDLAIKKQCELMPFDCMRGGTLSGYALDEFLKSFYADAELTAVRAGYTHAQFEYCQSNPMSCYVDIKKVTDKKIRRLHQEVKGSPFKITPIYPTRKNWWRASNGERYQFSSHLFFFRELSLDESDEYCTKNFLPGNKLKRNVARILRENPSIDFSEILRASKDSKAILRVKAPSLLSQEYVDKFGLTFECLLTTDKGRKDKGMVVFKSKLTRVNDFFLK